MVSRITGFKKPQSATTHRARRHSDHHNIEHVFDIASRKPWEACLEIRTIFAVVALLLLSTQVSEAATRGDERATPAEVSQMNCDGAAMNLPDDAKDAAKYINIPELGSVEKVHRAYAKWKNEGFHYLKQDFARCKDPKERNRIEGMLQADHAYVLHAYDNPEWHNRMNLTVQKLNRCVVDYYAQTKGAECETLLDEMISNKVKWNAEAR